jgi:hypothetical protein
MSVQFDGTQRPTSEAELDALEQRLGIVLPPEYRHHLSRYNGGHPEPCCFDYTENSGRPNSTLVGNFLAVHEGAYDNFELTYQVMKVRARRMPDALVPIADDQMGNAICMAFSGVDAGKIYLWEQDREADPHLGEEAGYENCHFVANSLQEFLSSLHDFEPQ